MSKGASFGPGSRPSDGAASVSTLSGFDPSRSAIVAWLRSEAAMAKRLQAAAPTMALLNYRMGQRDAYLLAADAIEREAIAMEAASAVETERLDPKDDSAGPKDIAQ